MPVRGFAQVHTTLVACAIAWHAGAAQDTTRAPATPSVTRDTNHLTVGRLISPPLVPLTITVRATEASPTHFDPRANLVGHCVATPACAAILHAAPAATLAPELRLREAVLRTAGALLTVRTRLSRDAVLCVRDADTTLLESLRAHFANVVPGNECSLVPPFPYGGSITHTPTRRRGVQLVEQGLTAGGDVAIADIGFYGGMGWGEGWTCVFKLMGDQWVVRSCTPTWVI